MTAEDYIRDHLKDMARYIDGEIPQGYGFILLVFPFGDGGIIQYVANARRLDAMQAMHEWIAMNTAETYGTDAGDKGKEGFEAWFAGQLARYKASNAEKPSEDPADIKQWCYDAWMAGMSNQSSK